MKMSWGGGGNCYSLCVWSAGAVPKEKEVRDYAFLPGPPSFETSSRVMPDELLLVLGYPLASYILETHCLGGFFPLGTASVVLGLGCRL